VRIIFAACPEIAVPSLNALSEMELSGSGIVLAGILTNPDRRRNHKHDEVTDVSAAAKELDAVRAEKGLPPIRQLKPEKLNSQAREEVASLAPDLLISFAYGHIFGPRFLSLFPRGGINIHPSLLPKFRGATPIPAAIKACEKETGICIQKIDLEMDCGDILRQEKFLLDGTETTQTLVEKSGVIAAFMLKELLKDFDSVIAAAKAQEGNATYCGQLKKEDGIIDWNKTAAELDAQIRAYTPWPLSFTSLKQQPLFLLEAKVSPPPSGAGEAVPGTVLGTDKKNGILIQTGGGVLAVSKLQWQAKKALDWKSFLNGARDFIGAQLE